MILNIPFIADMRAIQERRQHIINHNLIRQNKKCYNHDYQVNQHVYIKPTNPRKLDPRWIGPFKIIQTHTNGTITIERLPGVNERLNIRQIKPSHEDT